jgi:hypothetical protein
VFGVPAALGRAGERRAVVQPGETTLASVIEYLAAAVLGLLAGAMLLIAMAIVPFWTTLEPTEFARWFRDYSPLLGRFMLPLGASATALTMFAVALARPVSSPHFRWLAVAAALAVGVVAIYPLYFSSANAALAGGGLAASEIASELHRWRKWHWVRTGAGVLSFFAVLRGLTLSVR